MKQLSLFRLLANAFIGIGKTSRDCFYRAVVPANDAKLHTRFLERNVKFSRILCFISSALLLAGTAWADLPAGWTDTDIGSPGKAGSAGYTNGNWTVTGGGTDIYGTSDQFNFTYTANITGNATLTAKVLNLLNTDSSGYSKAALMFRNDTTAGSVQVCVAATATQGVQLEWRSSSGRSTYYHTTTGISAPVWLQLVRTNSTFTGYYSTDGANWTQIWTTNVTMNSALLAGLAVTSHNNNSALNVANYTSVTVGAIAATNPVVVNQPASSALATSATLNGQVVTPGISTPFVTIFYGTTDGSTNAASWANSVSLGQTNGNFSATVVGLTTNTAYYFTAYASNLSGVSWAQPSLNFTTLAANPTVTPVSVLTYRYDNTGQGANTNETLLTPANVNTNSFGKLFSYSLDGHVYAEPLIMTNVNIPGQGVHNVVFVATEHDSVYALDADSNSGTNGGVLWQNNIGAASINATAPYGRRYWPSGYGNIVTEVGITGTPVIDPKTGTLYVDVFTQDVASNTTNYNHRIHALDVTTGNERPYGPALVAGSVPGTGVGSTNGVLTFSPVNHAARAALTLANGIVIVTYASYGDTDPYHGWVFAYNATNLALISVFNTTPNATTDVFGSHAGEGAIWQGGAGICVDDNTNLYFMTGNGSFSANTNGGDYSDSFVKLSTTNGLSVADYFTPSDQTNRAAIDNDLGSGGPLLLPDSAGGGGHAHLIVGADKSLGKIFLVDRDNMGQFQIGSDNQIVESFTGIAPGCFSAPAYWNNVLYFQPISAAMKAFSITNGYINQTPLATSPASVGGANGGPVVSANGTNNGIVWVLNNNSGNSVSPGTLYAFNANNISQMLWSSAQLGSRDSAGPGVKMTTPTVAGGKVYVGGQYALTVYGIGLYLTPPVITPNGGVFTNSITVTISNTSPGSLIYYTTDGTAPSSSSTPYTGPFDVTSTMNVQAVAIEAGYVNSSVASASFVSSLGLPPPPWQETDIGPVGVAGSAYYSNGVFIVSGSGADIYNGGDAFQFVYQTATGDCTNIARVASVQNVNVWTKAGMMIRNDLSSNAVNAFVTVTASNGVTMQSRSTVGGNITQTQTLGLTAPYWVKLVRIGNTFTGYSSPDGVNWTPLGTNTFTMAPTAYVGLALTSHDNVNLATATFDYVTVNGITYTNPPPSVALTAPSANSTYTAAASVTVSADADALYEAIDHVDFYASSTLLGSISNAPYAVTATGLGANSYTLTAVAVSSSGLMSTSAPVAITVNAGSGQAYGLTNHAVTPAFLNMPGTVEGSLPPLLSETGVFSNTPSMTPVAGLIPYAPNVILWSDAASKIRYMAVPDNGGPLTPSQQIGFAPTNSWTFPAGTVFVKTFELQTNTSDPNSLRRLETRLLVRDINGAVYGVTYKWRPDYSDADLLTTSSNENIAITTPGGVTTQTWYYPSPSDCLQCHTPVANYVLGVNARQLNGRLTYDSTGVTDNQLRTLNRLGLFNPAFDETNIVHFEKLSALTNTGASFEERARSYLDANCAQCHQPGGTGITFDARYDTPLTNQNLIYGGLDSSGFAMIVPRDIWRSKLPPRMNTTNNAIKMPPLARSLIDSNAVAVMNNWINSLSGTPALAPVTITPSGGLFVNSVGVSLQSTNIGATIYYTLDGSLPTTNSFLYSSTFNLTSNTTVSASAFESNYVNSVTASALFYVEPLHFTSHGFNNGVFQLGFAGVTGSNYVLQASTNLINWTPVSTNLASTTFFNLFDFNATNYSRRFYRVIGQ